MVETTAEGHGGDGARVEGAEVVVRRDAIADAHVRTAARRVGAGEVLLAVERFSLTSNNVTYAVLGDQLRYWRFFPPAEDELGVVPVWGFAEVTRSRHPEVHVGERWYGYLPMATHAIVRPGRVDARGVVDASPHRAGLAAAYQRYERSHADPLQSRGTADLEALYRPLFVTAFLLADLVGDDEEIGAETSTVVVTSASSKTALATAFLLARRGGVDVVGLTSPSSVGSVAGSGLFDDVVPYAAAADLDLGGPAVLLDVAGRADVVEAVHDALGDGLAASMVVGVTHHDDDARAAPSAGPSPTPFFAPDRARRRADDWGAAELGRRVAEAWEPFVAWVGPRITVRHVEGLDAVPDEWAALVAGDVDTGEGIVVLPTGG